MGDYELKGDVLWVVHRDVESRVGRPLGMCVSGGGICRVGGNPWRKSRSFDVP